MDTILLTVTPSMMPAIVKGRAHQHKQQVTKMVNTVAIVVAPSSTCLLAGCLAVTFQKLKKIGQNKIRRKEKRTF